VNGPFGRFEYTLRSNPDVDQQRRSWTLSECRNVSLAAVLSGRYRKKIAL
jgi:hypothetical protein